MFLSLENRRLMSNALVEGQLSVVGTLQDDRIDITEVDSGKAVLVTVNKEQQQFNNKSSSTDHDVPIDGSRSDE